MALIVAFAVTVVATPFVARAATRAGIVDRPGPLKVHDRPVPYLGGVAVAAGLALPIAIARPAFGAPVALALLLGLADDATDLPPRTRVLCEVVIAAVAAAVIWRHGSAGAVVTAVAVLALLNAVNLLDGLDGLASGVGCVAALGFAVVLTGDARVLALALAGALAGILVWNRPPARIFLGDAGSYAIGTALGMLVGSAYSPGARGAVAAASLLFVAVPVADTTVAIVRRLRAGRPLFQGDRGHIYDQLVDRGRTPPAAAVLCISAQAAVAAVGLVAAALSAVASAVLVAGTVAVVGVAALTTFTSRASWQSPQ